jgi:hypothetical protein
MTLHQAAGLSLTVFCNWGRVSKSVSPLAKPQHWIFRNVLPKITTTMTNGHLSFTTLSPRFCDILPTTTTFLLSQCRLEERVLRFPWDNVLYQGILRAKRISPRKFWWSSLLSRLCSAGSFEGTRISRESKSILGIDLWRWFLQFVVCLCYLNFSQYIFHWHW